MSLSRWFWVVYFVVMLEFVLLFFGFNRVVLFIFTIVFFVFVLIMLIVKIIKLEEQGLPSLPPKSEQ